MNDHADLKDTITGPLSLLECDVLGDIAAATHADLALEVGHYLGLSTAVLLRCLPAHVGLVTVDHHRGDDWCEPTSLDVFLDNVKPHIGSRQFAWWGVDMREALPQLTGPYGFVFYDADHTAAAVADFWELAEPLMADDRTLVFDDADWAEQGTLRRFAESAGFDVVTALPFTRRPMDKFDPETFTLEIMRRGS